MLRTVDWPELRTLGIVQIATDDEHTWVRTLVPTASGGNLFAVDADTLSVTEVPLAERLEQIVAGAGQLWALSDDGRHLSLIDESTQHVRMRTLRRACDELSDPNGVVALGTLWLDCGGQISVYTPSGDGGRLLTAPKSLHVMASSDGVWVVAKDALIGIGGTAKGRRITVPNGHDARLWQSRADEAWAVELAARERTLIRVDLASGTTTRFSVPVGSDQIDDLSVGPTHIWVVLRDKPTLLRLDGKDPTRVLERTDLQRERPSADSQLFVTAGPSGAWIQIYGDHKTKLLLAQA